MESHVLAAGLDLGHQVTKAVVGPRHSDTQRVMLLSTILATEEGLATGTADLSRRTLMGTLDLSITSKALTRSERTGEPLADVTGRWLVGDVLVTNERLGKQALQAEENERKHLNPKLYVTGLAALAVLAQRRLRPAEDTFTINMLTASLPVSLCKGTDANRKEVARRLKGTHLVRFNNVADVPDGRTIKLVINKVRVLPEGLGAALAQIYELGQDLRVNHEVTQELKLRSKRPDLLEKTFGICDIGGRTTDFVFVKPGLDYDEAMSEGEAYGMMTYLEQIVSDVRKAADEPTILINEAELVRYLERWDGQSELTLPLRGSQFPIKAILDRHFKVLAAKVRDDLAARWSARVSEVFVVGGGCQTVKPYLAELFDQKYKPTFVLDDVQWQNAIGNLIFAVTQSEA